MVQVFIGGDTAGDVTEGSGVDATGQLNSVLLDVGEGIFFDPIVSDWTIVDPPDFGTATLADITDPGTGLVVVTGDSVIWRYTLDDSNPAVEDLVLGETLADSFVIQAAPTTSGAAPVTQTIDITIFGVCFAAGTLMATETGPVAVEDLRIGQKLLTRDNGTQPVLWRGGGLCPEHDWRGDPRLLPVRIRAGALGKETPARDLHVSQNHRILVCDARAELYFGETEVLVAAKHLCALPGVDIVEPQGPLAYYHILCGTHDVLCANGCPAESMLLGDEALVAIAPDDLMHLDDVMSGAGGLPEAASACRRILSRREAMLLLGVEDTAALPRRNRLAA